MNFWETFFGSQDSIMKQTLSAHPIRCTGIHFAKGATIGGWQGSTRRRNLSERCHPLDPRSETPLCEGYDHRGLAGLTLEVRTLEPHP